eukprot:403338212
MISLECLHRVCQKCIEQKLLKRDGGTTCFDCQEITQPEKYKKDPDALKVLNSLSLLPIFCENHSNISADVLCLSCDMLCCKKCANFFNEYLKNAADMLEHQMLSIQALLLQIQDMQENQTEIKSSEFGVIYKQVKSLLTSLIPDKKQLLKLDIQNYKMQQQPQENTTRVEIIRQVYERQLRNDQTGMYYQQYINLVNLELNKDEKSLLQTSEIENYQNSNFTLLYQGSRDGFCADSFHPKCDNQGPTVWFILSEFGEVFGFYNSMPWTSISQWQPDEKAFIFSLSKIKKNLLGWQRW